MIAVLWNLRLTGLVDRYQCFGRICCLLRIDEDERWGLRFALLNIATAKLCGITSRSTKIVTFAAMKLDLQNFNRILGTSCFVCSFYNSTAEILNSPATYPGWS